ncbi:MAG: hypothetical protein OEW11_05725 [Nitrospirota bacterium]|nr:hypothetical protein [Nitrospirota bacterium]
MGTLTELTQSLQRCTAQPGFFDRFYARLFELAPALRPMFDLVDMETQQAMIHKGITAFLVTASGARKESEFLSSVRASHGSQGLGLGPRDYAHWVNALLDTISVCDPLYSPQLGLQWRQVLEGGIRTLDRD